MITDLYKPAELNITGLCKFWFAPIDWFKYVSIKFLTQLEIKYIEFDSINNHRWLVGYNNNTITEVETTQKQSDNGIIYETNVIFFIPTDNENLRLQLHKMEQMPFILMVKETSGTVKIIGDKNSACKLSLKFTNKQGKKGYDLTFTCLNTNLPYIYKGVLPL